MKVSGSGRGTAGAAPNVLPTSAPNASRSQLMPVRRASSSITRNPTLCRVSRYSLPGLPSPTTSLALTLFLVRLALLDDFHSRYPPVRGPRRPPPPLPAPPRRAAQRRARASCRPHSLRSTFAPVATSRMRTPWPISSSVTLHFDVLRGISAGNTSISNSRVTKSRTPPCCFTPRASPFTVHRHGDGQLAVHRDPVEVCVKKRMRHRVQQEVAAGPWASGQSVELEADDGLGARLGVQDARQRLGIDGHEQVASLPPPVTGP